MFPQIKPSLVTKVYSSLAPSTSQATDTVPTPGDIRMDSNGYVYMFVKNNHASALVAGYVVVIDVANGVGYEVKQPVTAALNLMAGVAMGAIPASGYGWIMKRGYYATALVEGTTDIVLGDSLKGVDAQFYAVKDQATGTEATYARHLLALEAFTTNSTGSKKVWVQCL